ncbi:PucR family transcriptional regulator ligand-binding domain-containing protein [Streptomyces sp. NPDC127079]|uniref:PucR family transcriptional regulator ligand-binding domain-containing protein n=1 Tax=Streptomyces sp. NPDC127079 TaxID=3347132 RepID=UPI003667DAF6
MPDHKATSPSVLTVGDLLSFPALQMRLLAGGGGLGRTVSWAHVSELEDPTPWLHGSEVIMTVGLAVPRAGEAQRRYLERLDDAGVAALVLSTQLRTPPLRQGGGAAPAAPPTPPHHAVHPPSYGASRPEAGGWRDRGDGEW